MIQPAEQTGKNNRVVNTGLTGQTVLLYADDAERYQAHLRGYEDHYQPRGLRERELVQSLADIQWRLNRVSALEMAIFAQGRAANQSKNYGDVAPEIAAHMMELDIYLKFEKQLRNLQLQESRLLRRYEKERKELLSLQAFRKLQTAAEAAAPLARGFEFSKLSTAPEATVDAPASPNALGLEERSELGAERPRGPSFARKVSAIRSHETRVLREEL